MAQANIDNRASIEALHPQDAWPANRARGDADGSFSVNIAWR